MDAYTDVALPGPDQQALLAMLAAPGGVSTRAAAAALPWSHTRVHQQLQRWQRDGVAELRGKGSGRRWHRAGGQAPGGAGYRPLRAVPDAAKRRTVTGAALAACKRPHCKPPGLVGDSGSSSGS